MTQFEDVGLVAARSPTASKMASPSFRGKQSPDDFANFQQVRTDRNKQVMTKNDPDHFRDSETETAMATTTTTR